jgi:hypothetical protein
MHTGDTQFKYVYQSTGWNSFKLPNVSYFYLLNNHRGTITEDVMLQQQIF